MAGGISRLYRGETTVNFYGRRNIGFIFSALLLIVTVGSLFSQGLNLGIDFKGGVAFEVPVSGSMSEAKAKEILTTNKIKTDNVKIQTLTSGSTQRVRIQLGDSDPHHYSGSASQRS